MRKALPITAKVLAANEASRFSAPVISSSRSARIANPARYGLVSNHPETSQPFREKAPLTSETAFRPMS
jgi:hypothetical protein